MKVLQQSVVFRKATAEALIDIEEAGRTCYRSENKITEHSSEEFVRKIIKRGHESVLEHASASFKIVCDRGISHEIVRHRLASFSQESTRYVKYGQLEVILPPTLNNETWKNIYGTYLPVYINEVSESSLLFSSISSWIRSCLVAEKCYCEMLDAGERPEIARSVLPTCTRTELVMTCNFREWRHFLRMRHALAAHPQVREVAGIVKLWFKENYPVIIEDI